MDNQAFIIKDLGLFQHDLAGQYEMYQIARDQQGEVNWQLILNKDKLALYGAKNIPLVSPKKYFFAENEAVYEFDGETFKPIQVNIKPRVFFGMQACDLTAIAYMDKFFASDPQYQARREQTLLVGIDCTEPCNNGFCPVVNAGPQVNRSHADLILSDLSVTDDTGGEGQWLMLVISDKGRSAVKNMSLNPANEVQIDTRKQINQKVISQFKDFSYISNAVEKINNNLVPAEVWEELSVRCLQCSGCTSLCPTCSCFSNYHQTDAESGKTTAIRCWDSCQFDGFQREASGHNPSHLAAQRTERFWFHKFSDQYLAEFERYGCVGCGRCEQTCPGSIGVHSVMQRIEKIC